MSQTPVVGKIKELKPSIEDNGLKPGIISVQPPRDNSVLTMIYLLYITNMIDNRGLKRMLDSVAKTFPDDIAAYLVKEAAKVS